MQDKPIGYLPDHSKMTLLPTLFFFMSLKDLVKIYNGQLEVHILGAVRLSWKPHSYEGISHSLHPSPLAKINS